MKPVLEQLVRWQLRNPEGPEEEALEWVREWVGVEVANARLVIEKDVKADAKTEVGADVNADVKVEVGAEVRAEV